LIKITVFKEEFQGFLGVKKKKRVPVKKPVLEWPLKTQGRHNLSPCFHLKGVKDISNNAMYRGYVHQHRFKMSSCVSAFR